jgi:hypothetical protein
MATTKQSDQVRKIKKIQEIAVSASQWDHWYQCRNARLWHAVLLSMNIEPSTENRVLLKTHYPAQYQLYVDRLNILLRRQSSYKPIKALVNSRNGETPKTKYVSLVGVLRFAKKENWDGIESFEKGMTPKQIKALDGSLVIVIDDNDSGKALDTAKGHRYTQVRYAALVCLLEIAISDADRFNDIFPNKKVSDASLGKAVEETVAQLAKDKNRSVVQGFRREKNAKEIGEIKKIVKEYFL